MENGYDPKTAVLKAGSPGQQHPHITWALIRDANSWPHPDLLNQNVGEGHLCSFKSFVRIPVHVQV